MIDVAEDKITWQANLPLGSERRVKWINVKTELLQNKAPSLHQALQGNKDVCGDKTLLYLVDQMIGDMAHDMVTEVMNEYEDIVWSNSVLLPRYTIKIVNVKQTSITICQTTVDLHPLFKELNKRGIVHESMANDLSRHLKQFL